MSPKLYLIPNVISDAGGFEAVSSYRIDEIENIRYFFVEQEKAARRLLKKICPSLNPENCEFFALNEHTPRREIRNNFKETRGKDIGLISEAGLPCVADPGSELVFLAHQHAMDVIPLIGPSSIFLALAASGLNGQNFAFVGYLPKERKERLQRIKNLERRSLLEGQTQIFMETPYHGEDLFREIISVCDQDTLCCIASDLTGAAQYIKTSAISAWQGICPTINKKPTLFLLQKRAQRDVKD